MKRVSRPHLSLQYRQASESEQLRCCAVTRWEEGEGGMLRARGFGG